MGKLTSRQSRVQRVGARGLSNQMTITPKELAALLALESQRLAQLSAIIDELADELTYQLSPFDMLVIACLRRALAKQGRDGVLIRIISRELELEGFNASPYVIRASLLRLERLRIVKRTPDPHSKGLAAARRWGLTSDGKDIQSS